MLTFSVPTAVVVDSSLGANLFGAGVVPMAVSVSLGLDVALVPSVESSPSITFGTEGNLAILI